MHFPDVTIGSVKAISQRALFGHWHRAAGGRRFPSLTEFNPGDRIHDPKQLVFWRVERQGPAYRFRALYQGNHVSDAFSAQWVGRTLDEVVPDFARYFIMMSTRECAASGCPIYSIIRTRDANRNAIDCERLLLPLGRTEVVEQIVVSMQLVSPNGEFRRNTALKNFESKTELVLTGKIGRPRHLLRPTEGAAKPKRGALTAPSIGRL